MLPLRSISTARAASGAVSQRRIRGPRVAIRPPAAVIAATSAGNQLPDRVAAALVAQQRVFRRQPGQRLPPADGRLHGGDDPPPALAGGLGGNALPARLFLFGIPAVHTGNAAGGHHRHHGRYPQLHRLLDDQLQLVRLRQPHVEGHPQRRLGGAAGGCVHPQGNAFPLHSGNGAGIVGAGAVTQGQRLTDADPQGAGGVPGIRTGQRGGLPHRQWRGDKKAWHGVPSSVCPAAAQADPAAVGAPLGYREAGIRQSRQHIRLAGVDDAGNDVYAARCQEGRHGG